jgi:lysylphosphatidylglycerol synthetase-like protein (DUF2156 family)
MRHINHLGSALLLFMVTLLLALLLLPSLGVTMDWQPKTTPYRLVTTPFIAWSLVAVLGAGLALIRLGSQFQQCTNALVLVGLIFGLAVVSGLFWDPWLSPTLVWAALPILRSATMTLRTLVR